MKLLPCLPVSTELVVGNTLFGVLEHLIGLADLLETRLRVRFLAHVWMVLARQLAIGALDLILRGIAFDAHDPVIVFEFHSLPSLHGLSLFRATT